MDPIQPIEGNAPTAFASVDSMPKGLSHPVPLWYVPALLLVFSAISVAMLLAVTILPAMRELFPSGDLVIGYYDGTHSISVRVFILSFFAAYAVFCHANPWKKLLMGLDLYLTFALICLAIDLASMAAYKTFAISFPLSVIEILSGIMGFGVFSIKLLERGRMPPSVPMTIDNSRNIETLTRASLVALLSAGVAIYVTNMDATTVHWLRAHALMGGIGPGVFLFIPAFFLVLYLGGLLDQMMFRSKTYHPDISVIVPAHNESHIVRRTLEGIDGAAAVYQGQVTVLFVDNASSDNTYEAAVAVAAELTNAHVTVLQEPRPGKANALNLALANVRTDYFVRIDADTVVRPNAFARAMTYFKSASVGVVGGLPLPPGDGPFDHARYVESVVKHGMYSVSLAAINGLVGVPGMFVIFRTELPRKLGGFVGGMNGEDTDMSLRIGELGYRLIIDPEVRYISEVPHSYAHMREQRLRWFRSVYHVTARCRTVVFSSKITFRGKVILPYMLVNSARRSMMVPLILFGMIEYFGNFKPIEVLQWQAVLAVVLGAPLLASITALVLNGYFWQILYLPEYMLFRMLRSYFTLESMLTINQRLKTESLYRDTNIDRPDVNVAAFPRKKRSWRSRISNR
ncbi:Glycosyltransferase, catalytic subunit of cellulose synthase and poly-beta-1,6-N-acetylglucosamine synthase [Monaibacterium marinum]|uniref:Glycosyltransferase, catalytic subunit of cellulose synthase and poly-beta-1,6-N-acetylglucosamine synthase n=1 Tax=Pontivivens marinum TaxID=1690039 RepID=A0A2C9CMJ3_9RHOB|nr:glycosyltransferase [Monaibacterium marinum]SOH92415.1 Glycosyltransferase, catalytic subunit of cellulose synthase and poly-beta-1,6-N-acetylglucosamine synthase [Monaibacterium marinum]